MALKFASNVTRPSFDLLSGFTQDDQSPDEIDEVLREIRRLWLFAPDDVIKAGNAFIEAI